MKTKKLALFLLTLAVVGSGSIAFATSITQMKGSIQEELSTEMLITIPEETEVVEDISVPMEEDTSIMLWKINPFKYNKKVTYFYFFHEGVSVRVKDNQPDEDISRENAEIMMNFIYDYVDKTLLQPYGIDKSEYHYDIQSQDHMLEGVNYCVFLEDPYGNPFYSIGICLEDGEPKLRSFSRDSRVYLEECNNIPDEFLAYNWSETTEKREAIYAKYLDSSKKVIARLGLPAVVEEYKNVDSRSYFEAGETWATVCFGYVLEDGTYIRVFYNRVNGLWDGFCIAGYYEDALE